VSYRLEIPLDSFNLKAFSDDTGIKQNRRWSAVLRPKNAGMGYHVHFNGDMDTKYANLTIEYWNGAKKAAKDEKEPFAESIMSWLRSFVKDPSPRATVMATFEKPIESWRSRFNLPFKVTMADVEVIIDGISVSLPRNQFRAVGGFLSRDDRSIFAIVRLVRNIELATFDIAEEVATFNEAVKLFVEPIHETTP
jgi:hypothetical protein